MNARGPTRTAALVYWLVLVAGLVAFGVRRALSPTLEWYALPAELAPAWVGAVLGVAVGQVLARLRLRPWLVLVLATSIAFGPWRWLIEGLFVLDPDDGLFAVSTATVFAPAVVGGYLALSERGALVAYWFPTVSWMVALLDGQTEGAFDRTTTAAVLAALGLGFVAFLRAREARRADLWRTRSVVRIAPTRSRTVLRASPLRGALEHATSVVLAVVALGVVASVAPRLWQVDAAHAAAPSRPTNVVVTRVEQGFGVRGPVVREPMPKCCATYVPPHVATARVREYLPLLERPTASSASDDEWASCVSCFAGVPVLPSYETDWSRSGTAGSGEPAGATTYGVGHGYGSGGDGGYGSGGGGGYGDAYGGTAALRNEDDGVNVVRGKVGAKPVEVAVTPSHTTTAATHPTPTPEAHPAGAVSSPAVLASDAPAPPSPAGTTEPHAEEAVRPVPPIASAPSDARGSLGSLSAAVGLAFALHLVVRAVRRALVLRHLAQPFWREPADQRVSNHWERMLVGLRDAGIAPRRGEAPMAFAKRVGIAGMETCAEVLERTRHGVGLEPTDLAAMAAASASVYATARHRAGPGARALAWFRWPLA